MIPSALRALALAVMPLSLASQTPTFVLPTPTGQFGVGTTSWIVTDPKRIETFLPGRTPREVKVFAWYPTARRAATDTARRAPYLRESIAEARTFASRVRADGVYDGLAAVTTHSYLDEPLVPGSEKLPVLVFSHGYTGLVSAYTSLLEDLASQGYLVLSVAHPYEAILVTLSRGGVASLLDSTNTLRRGVADVIGEWDAEDSIMTRVTQATDETKQREILRAYLEHSPNTRATIDRWVKDLQLVLDQLPSATAGIQAQIARRADLSRIGILGHSMGGVVSGQFCVDDSRCRAGLNLDGIPQSGSMIDAKFKAPFLMVYSARPGRLGASDPIYRRAAARYTRVDFAQTRHLDFSDMNFWGGPLDAPGAHGPMTPSRAAELTRMVVREYFDAELRAKPSALLNGTVTVPELTVRRPAADLK